MTPAEELRAAAKQLRDLAAAATSGTWHVVPYEDSLTGHEAGIGTTPDEDDIAGTGYEGGGLEWARDARYIVAMQPRVGTALANWLDLEETYLVGMPDNERLTHVRAALAVARAINGQP